MTMQAPQMQEDRWENVKNEALRPGDVVHVLGVKRITAIRPYRGPFNFIFAIADTAPGVGFSLEKGGYTDRLKIEEGYDPEA